MQLGRGSMSNEVIAFHFVKLNQTKVLLSTTGSKKCVNTLVGLDLIRWNGTILTKQWVVRCKIKMSYSQVYAYVDNII